MTVDFREKEAYSFYANETVDNRYGCDVPIPGIIGAPEFRRSEYMNVAVYNLYILPILVVGIFFLLSLAIQVWQDWVYMKWGAIDNSRRISGAETAQLILSTNALNDVVVTLGIDRGYMVRDAYDPRSKIVWLSLDNFKGESVTALAVSAQRSAQALQDASGYPMFRLRSWLLPLANFGATYGPIMLPFGILTGFLPLLYISALLFVGAILIHLVTLPVEFNANQRALRQMENLELVSEQKLIGVRRVLAAAAMAYEIGRAHV